MFIFSYTRVFWRVVFGFCARVEPTVREIARIANKSDSPDSIYAVLGRLRRWSRGGLSALWFRLVGVTTIYRGFYWRQDSLPQGYTIVHLSSCEIT